MELRQARQLARELIDEHGLSHVEFKFSNARSRHGQCLQQRNWLGESVYVRISLSRYYVLMNDENDIRKTIIHEIAHALTLGHGHDRVWQLKAMELGISPSRTGKSNMPKGRWKGTCSICGEVFYKHRGGKHVRNGGYRHHADGGKVAFIDTRKVLALR